MLKREVSKKQIFWISVIALAVFLILISGGDSGTTSTTNNLTVGDVAILNSNSSKSDCSGDTAIALSREAYDDLNRSAAAEDTYGYGQVFLQGRAVFRKNCIEVKLIDVEFASWKVRLVDEPEIAGWIPYEWIVTK